MENPGSKILSFEEFMQQGSSAEPIAPNMDMPTEVPAEIPAQDGDPAGDMPVVSDVELVDGGSADMQVATQNDEEKPESTEDAQ
jgi:hypothetical protein